MHYRTGRGGGEPLVLDSDNETVPATGVTIQARSPREHVLKAADIDALEGTPKVHFLNSLARRINESLGDRTGLRGLGSVLLLPIPLYPPQSPQSTFSGKGKRSCWSRLRRRGSTWYRQFE